MNKENIIRVLIFLMYKTISVFTLFAAIGGFGFGVKNISSYGSFVFLGVFLLIIISILFWFFGDEFVSKRK